MSTFTPGQHVTFTHTAHGAHTQQCGLVGVVETVDGMSITIRVRHPVTQEQYWRRVAANTLIAITEAA